MHVKVTSQASSGVSSTFMPQCGEVELNQSQPYSLLWRIVLANPTSHGSFQGLNRTVESHRMFNESSRPAGYAEKMSF